LRLFIYISFIILALCSCTASRKTSFTSITERKDSLVSQSQDSNASQFTHFTERVKEDSTVGIAPKAVDDSLLSAVLNFHREAKIPVYKEKTVNGLKAWVAIDTSGNLRYGASADSFTLVVKGLIREKDSISYIAAAYKKQIDFRNAVVSTATDKEVVKEKQTVGGWLLSNVWWIAIVMFIVVMVVKKYYF